MASTLSALATRLVPVRHGERRRALLLFTYLFLSISSYVATKATRDALFLERYSAGALPYADLASAAAVMLVMAGYLRLRRRIRLPALQMATLTFFASASVGFWWLARGLQPAWMLPTLYIWTSVFGVLLPVQVWTLANYVVTTKEAKRLFGLIGSGAITGGIVGGLVTTAIARRTGAETLLVATALAVAVCVPLVAAIWRERRVADVSAPTPSDPLPQGLRTSLALIAGTPYLRGIATLVGLASLVTTIAAWQFRAVAKLAVPNTNDLAAFFGTFNAYAGALSLAVQLLVTARLLKRFGLGVALLITPLALAGGSAALALTGTLAAAVLLKGGDQVLRYAIDRPAFELLYLPLPNEQTFAAKSCIDTVVLRVGDCLGSLAVIVLGGAAWLALAPRTVGIATLVLAPFWIAAVVAARRQYVATLGESIQQHRIDAESAEATLLDRTASQALDAALEADNADDLAYALDLLQGRESTVPAATIRRLLGHPSAQVRRGAIGVLAAAGDTDAIDAIDPLVDDPDGSVRTEALLFLTRVAGVDPLTRVQHLDAIGGASLHMALVGHLARQGPHQDVEAARLLLDAVMADGLPSPSEQRAIAEAFGGLPDDALAVLGDAAVALARTLLERGESEVRVRVPALLQRIGTAEAERVLADFLYEPDAPVRMGVVAALNKLRQYQPRPDLGREDVETLLSAEILGHYRSYQLLAAGDLSSERRGEMEGELERIFRLLKLLYPGPDLHSAWHGAQSESLVVHDHAIEFLEQTLPLRIRRLLVPLIDRDVSVAERAARAMQLVDESGDGASWPLAGLRGRGDRE
jgi:AAA family ATP:ADP antiporter